MSLLSIVFAETVMSPSDVTELCRRPEMKPHSECFCWRRADGHVDSVSGTGTAEKLSPLRLQTAETSVEFKLLKGFFFFLKQSVQANLMGRLQRQCLFFWAVDLSEI